MGRHCLVEERLEMLVGDIFNRGDKGLIQTSSSVARLE
jgi:hypothetical protein